MTITNHEDILSFIQAKLMLDNSIAEIVSSASITDNFIDYPVRKELIHYLFIHVGFTPDTDNIAMSLNYDNSDNSSESQTAKNIFKYLSNDTLECLQSASASGNVCQYITEMTSINDAVSHIASFIKQIQKALQNYKEPSRKANINWDFIMEKGAEVHLTDNGRYNVIDNNGKPVIAKYLGNNLLKCQGVIGSSSKLATLFINTYGSRRNKTYNENGNECWTFNGIHIKDCKQNDNISNIKQNINNLSEITENNILTDNNDNIIDNEYFDTFALRTQKHADYDKNKPFIFIDEILIMASKSVNKDNIPEYFIIKKDCKFHDLCKHQCLENNILRQDILATLHAANILAVKFTNEGIVYTFTKDISSNTITEIIGKKFTLNLLAVLIGLNINVWTEHENYFINGNNEHISKFYYKNGTQNK